jgi:hypothetical protein
MDYLKHRSALWWTKAALNGVLFAAMMLMFVVLIALLG